jgi:tetratricopeptide (TPR) repeat protein
MKKATLLLSAVLVLFVFQAAFAQDTGQLSNQAINALRNKDYPKAIELYNKVLEKDPGDVLTLYNIACAYSLNGDKEKALDALKKSVKAGYSNFGHMNTDPDLAPIRDTEEFKALLKAGPPKGPKDPDAIIKRLEKKYGDTFKYKKDEEYKLVIASDVSDDRLKRIVATMHTFAGSLHRDLFKNKADYYLTIIIPKDAETFRKIMGSSGVSAGAYVHMTKTLYVNLSTGLGTMTHEFTHALHFADMEALRQSHPIWISEGFGTLHEQCTQKDGKVIGLTNWRLPGLQKALRAGKSLPWKTIFRMSHGQFMQRATNAYQISRYIFYYLQEKGLLHRKGPASQVLPGIRGQL